MSRRFDTHEQLPEARLHPAERLQGWHEPLNSPVWTNIYHHLRADDPVLGVCVSGEARAMPWWIMKDHHVANFEVSDLHIVVTLCVICSGAAAFRAQAAGRRLTFRLRGQYNAMPLIGDTETGTLWSPFSGIALAGTMRGSVLERLPLLQCLWSEWLAMHPATLVLYGDQSMRLGQDSAHSPGSPGIGPGLRQSLVRPIDKRLAHNTLVLGVHSGAAARAYPLRTLAQIGPVLNDLLGDDEIVVRCQPGTLQALAFDRRVSDRTLVFRPSETGVVYDEQTRSVWNEMGEAVSGPLAGTQLKYVNSGIEEWYAFAADHPHAEIFGV